MTRREHDHRALDAAAGQAPVAVAVVDRDGRLRWGNAALAASDVLPVLEPVVARVVGRGEAVTGVEVVAGDRRFAAACWPLDDGAAAVLVELPRDGGLRAAPLPRDRVGLALEATEIGFWEWDIARDRVRWSDNMGPLYGLERGAQPASYGDYLAGLADDAERAELRAKVRAAVERGEDYARDTRIVLPDGTERWLHNRAHVLRGEDGRPSVVVGTTSEVTERRRREEHLSFLAEASEPLFRSLDPMQTLQEIAQLAVPRLADWCAIQLAPDVRGSFERIAVAHVDPEKVRWARELEQRYPPDPSAPTGAPQVIRSGRSELYPTIDDALLQASAQDAEHLELIRQLRMTSAMVVPLRARDHILGALTFIYAESGRHYGTAELELAEELGRRAGIALDHARLYARERSTAEVLQRALLPAQLPAIPGHELAVRYRPGETGDHTGGDFYDAFPLGDGRFGVVIGDIGGRGVLAAASMGQIRNALRAYALTERSPERVIDRLHALTDALSDNLFATVAYVVLEPLSGRASIASAGHLPPLVVGPGAAARLLEYARCPPLGVGLGPVCPAEDVVLAPGQTLVLYTDGLVETRDQLIDTGIAALAEVAASTADRPPEAMADAVVELGIASGDDDVAVLLLRRSAS